MNKCVCSSVVQLDFNRIESWQEWQSRIGPFSLFSRSSATSITSIIAILICIFLLWLLTLDNILIKLSIFPINDPTLPSQFIKHHISHTRRSKSIHQRVYYEPLDGWQDTQSCNKVLVRKRCLTEMKRPKRIKPGEETCKAGCPKMGFEVTYSE